MLRNDITYQVIREKTNKTKETNKTASFPKHPTDVARNISSNCRTNLNKQKKYNKKSYTCE